MEVSKSPDTHSPGNTNIAIMKISMMKKDKTIKKLKKTTKLSDGIIKQESASSNYKPLKKKALYGNCIDVRNWFINLGRQFI